MIFELNLINSCKPAPPTSFALYRRTQYRRAGPPLAKIGQKTRIIWSFAEGHITGPDMKSEHFSFGRYINILTIWNQFNIHTFYLNLWPSRTVVRSQIFHFIWSQWIFKVCHSFLCSAGLYLRLWISALLMIWDLTSASQYEGHRSPIKLKFGFWTQNCLNFQDLLQGLAYLEPV